MTAVNPTRQGVSVSLDIPRTASGRTTLYVYGSNGNYWYQYTTRTGKVDLAVSSLRANQGYTFVVTNGSNQVGTGSFRI